MASFQEIQDEISAMLDIPDDELTDDQRNTMDEYLDELGQQEADKIDAFAQFIKLESARMEALKEESKRLAAKAKTTENRIGYLKSRYMAVMQEYGLSKVKGNIYGLGLRASESVAITALLDDLPKDYLRIKTTVEPDKTAIKAALKAGIAIPGCTLAKSYSLQIR